MGPCRPLTSPRRLCLVPGHTRHDVPGNQPGPCSVLVTFDDPPLVVQSGGAGPLPVVDVGVEPLEEDDAVVLLDDDVVVDGVLE